MIQEDCGDCGKIRMTIRPDQMEEASEGVSIYLAVPPPGVDPTVGVFVVLQRDDQEDMLGAALGDADLLSMIDLMTVVADHRGLLGGEADA